ncbi:unnamed protein product [Chironomus riparius]|uniref:FAM20 C-terminal domain-containing protein n=1 Tax=Chironomus riparius TaxID=315576 RepID=A0A9N9WVY8_9DIPT|nr:unnamed protein product [Chironomus riparius]
MKKQENPSLRYARYFWGSLLGFTILLIFDIITGFGVTSAVIGFLFPGKVINLKEPTDRPIILPMRKEDVKIPPTLNDPYDDLRVLVVGEIPEKFKNIIINKHHLDVPSNPTMKEFLNMTEDEYISSLERFQNRISQHEMYPEDDRLVQRVLHNLATAKFNELYEKSGGTQFKMIVKYENGYRALFKPMRLQRDQQAASSHYYYNDYERHNGEIASYHLDKILGFRRAIPMVGRKINLTSEMFPLVDDELASTFYISPSGKVCFTGVCDVFCDTSHGICGDPYMLEGSFAAFLPRHKNATRKVWRHPWRRSYSKRRNVEWEWNDNFCDKVKQIFPYSEGRRMLDLMDMAIYDFLIGNLDRHHYETFKTFNTNETFTIHLDQGRSFGQPFHDELSILIPLKQCCMVRKSTLKTLLDFHKGPQKMSDALRESLKDEPVAPILWDPHFDALDRRNVIVLEHIRNCLKVDDEK